MEKETGEFRSAFVALVGRPNSGKSTLLNSVLGEDLALVTYMPQTTRIKMRGIYNSENCQIVFVDTPGLHRGKHIYNKVMYKESIGTFKDRGIDIICNVVDISRYFGKEEDDIAMKLSEVDTTICLVFNKIDLCRNVNKIINEYLLRYPQFKMFPKKALSAISDTAKEQFLDLIDPYIKKGPKHFPEDNLTDSNLRYFASEYLRKQIIGHTRQEVPHATFVEITEYKEVDGKHYIQAEIHVETSGQKGIVIGRNAQLIKKIRKQAEKEMRKLTGEPVSISCFVKVTPRWRDNKNFLSEMGMDIK